MVNGACSKHASVPKNLVHSMNVQSQMIAPVFSVRLFAVIVAHQMALHSADADVSKFVVPETCSTAQFIGH